MALEIERKFLINGDAWRQQVTQSKHFDQGYLHGPGGLSSVRVRLADDEARLNIKASVVGRARAEYDYPIPQDDAREILRTLCVGRVTKTRHFVPADVGVWEIDEFEGDNAGLVVAEIELNDENQTFIRPDWLGEEVTDDARYYNHALALSPYQSWNYD